MIELNDIASNITAFINNLFILEFGADEFIDDTAIIAARLNVSPALITLLASDAEWEELIIVIVPISQYQSSLAIGNIIGLFIHLDRISHVPFLRV